ncbi:MAG: hypothetical protein GY737_00085 [Desulfobacteraceae bacterium]|nr:hypothetical protein [Desulfobacteraceae bacterium]
MPETSPIVVAARARLKEMETRALPSNSYNSFRGLQLDLLHVIETYFARYTPLQIAEEMHDERSPMSVVYHTEAWIKKNPMEWIGLLGTKDKIRFIRLAEAAFNGKDGE